MLFKNLGADRLLGAPRLMKSLTTGQRDVGLEAAPRATSRSASLTSLSVQGAAAAA